MAAEWYSEQPQNRNFLSPVGFKLDLEIFHGVDFFCQSASIPEIAIPFAEVQTPYRNVPIAGSGGINFGDLQVRFLIDEELKNYNEIHKWIRKYGLSDTQLVPGESDLYSNARLMILTSHSNTNHIVEFVNIFPVSLSGVPFDATVGDVEYFSADVTFKYEKYELLDEGFKKLT